MTISATNARCQFASENVFRGFAILSPLLKRDSPKQGHWLQMSGGQIAIRGFLVQTLVALLEALQDDQPWKSITLEPNVDSEKVDILWIYEDNATKAVQVKSTEKTFSKSNVERWSRDLEAWKQADDYELILAGTPGSSAVAQLRKIGRVRVPPPKNLDLDAFMEQAAHKLDGFLRQHELPTGSADQRMMVAEALAGKLATFSTRGKPFTRDELVSQLEQWVPRDLGSDVPTQSTARQPEFVEFHDIDQYAPAELVGRKRETDLLNEAWRKTYEGALNRPHVLTFVALGGEGKTSLVTKWAAQLAAQRWLGCECVFVWSFYRQGSREQSAASSDLFLSSALTKFGDPEAATSSVSAFEKGRKLANLLGSRRAILILDGLEPLQYPPGSPMAGHLKDQGIAALLTVLAANSNGLCVVTTRYEIADLTAWRQTTAPQHELPRLSREAGVRLLVSIGVKGGELAAPAGGNLEPMNRYERLVEDVNGHALALTICGRYLVNACGGRIEQREKLDLQTVDEKIQGGHAFRAMGAYVDWLSADSDESRRQLAVLRLMGLFDRPATSDCLNALLGPPTIPGLTEPLVGMEEDDWGLTLTALESARLLTVNRDIAGAPLSIDAHPLIREYFACELQGKRLASPQIVPTGGSEPWRAGHERLYQHLCATTDEGDAPLLKDLQPLYHAVAHGCHAGRYNESFEDVYRARIVRHHEYYAPNKLGVWGTELGALTCYFEKPWSQISQACSDTNQAELLHEAGYTLRALGRLQEAVGPFRLAVDKIVELAESDSENGREWAEAARATGNLSELEVMLGQLPAAIDDARKAVVYADRGTNPFGKFMQWVSRAIEADAIHESGFVTEADRLFRNAEVVESERHPDYPMIYGRNGFEYCDSQLRNAERAAWWVLQGGMLLNQVDGQLNRDRCLEICRATADRAQCTIQWTEAPRHQGLLAVALDQLTLARAAIYQSLIKDANVEVHRALIDRTVSDLRSAGQQQFLPLSLLTRALQRCCTGRYTGPDSAQADLDESWMIVSRGPMRLLMADVHLHRARLFESRNVGARPDPPSIYPWGSAEKDLQEARRLIEEHGYLRRRQELEDAEYFVNDVDS